MKSELIFGGSGLLGSNYLLIKKSITLRILQMQLIQKI